MNARQEAKLAMYKGLEQHFDENPSIVGVVAAFQTATVSFKAVIANIINLTQLQSVPLKGIAASKSTIKQHLCRLTAEAAAILYAFASNTANQTLRAEVDFKYTHLVQTRDDELEPLCRNIYDRAFQHKDALADYGITSAKLTALDSAIDGYASETPKPRTALGNRKTYKANLVAEFKEGDRILKEVLDNLILNYREPHADFYNTYFNLRAIPEPPTTKTQLKGTITRTADQTPVKDALVTIVEAGKSAKTKSTGEYSFKPIPHGAYTVRVTAQGFADFEAEDVEVKLGEINHLDVELTGI